MHVVGQIIEKNLHRRQPCTSGLWINPDKDDNWQAARQRCSSMAFLSQDYRNYRFLKQAGADIGFSAFPTAGMQSCQWVILNLPRQKALLSMMLHCASTLMGDDGVLWLAGENKAGIKSAEKILKKYFGQVRKLDNARHCTLFEASNRLALAPFASTNYLQKWDLDCQRNALAIASYPGVFAHGRLDSGTALLLEALTEVNLEGDVLDFACGAGPIGACIAANQPQTKVTLLDSNALALEAARETLSINQLTGSVLASDGLSEIHGSYDYIISNPPIHDGVKTDNLLSQGLLMRVQEHINPGGMLIIVANRHLPYEKWLSQRFSQFSDLVTNAQFKVIAAYSGS